jgi:hypothetical protein
LSIETVLSTAPFHLPARFIAKDENQEVFPAFMRKRWNENHKSSKNASRPPNEPRLGDIDMVRIRLDGSLSIPVKRKPLLG